MKTIRLADIVIKPSRQRREFDIDRLSELRDSIAGPKGLLHPIVLENDGKTLVAGERRQRAVKLLNAQGKSFQHDGVAVPIGSIPYTTLGELSEHDLEEAQLEENLLRVDLTWQEKAAAMEKLFGIRAEQSNKTPTIGQLAGEVVGHEPSSNDRKLVRESLLLAPHLHDKEIASAPTQKEAIRRLEKKARRETNTKLAEILGGSVLHGEHKLILGDMREELPRFDSGGFACIIVDPPYGVGASEFGTQATTIHKYDDSPDYANDVAKHIAYEGFRIAADQAHLYMFCDLSNWSLWTKLLAHAGWDVWPRPIVWDKGAGMLPRPEHGPRYTYELIIFANKGDRRTNAVYADVVHVPAVVGKEHAAEKPVELYVDLLKRSVTPGDLVLDMCCGSGPVFPAANRLKLRATGIELDEANYAVASQRIGE